MSEALATDDRGDIFASGRIPYSRYQLTARIGKGGMAEVFRAVVKGPEGFERELVVKRILPKFSSNPQFVSMFVNEAKICALLSHPNIVQIYEFGEAEGTYFIAMESVHGVSLRDAMAKLRHEQRAMPFLVAADITRQICLGLDYAHTLAGADGAPLEIIHRDISPPNIMLAFNGTAKVVDFGIARAASFAEAETRDGIIKGKVSYLAPEQINRQPIDARVDVFATGVLMHEMLTGRRLFTTNNELAKMRQLLMQPSAPPSAVNASIPRELDRIALRALERDPARRYPSAAAMAADLERTLIAARHSSRDLARMLRELYHPPEETPIIITDGAQEVPRNDAANPGAPARSITAASETGDVPVTESFRSLGSAERTRLMRARWRTRLATTALLAAVTSAAVMGTRVCQRFVPALWQRYAAPLLHPPLPSVSPVSEAVAAPLPPEPTPPPAVSKPATRPSKSSKRPPHKH
ncbi:MAG TPA: serine/threonine-protein kinase [Polyangia bacterium]|nr:serine/threonine-protein kinase [Polyangia bacterium]